jgi:hypothetical protein
MLPRLAEGDMRGDVLNRWLAGVYTVPVKDAEGEDGARKGEAEL